MLIYLKINESVFMKVASIGLNSEKYQKYFKQIIACDNYVYFNCMMIKRNMILTNETIKLMNKHIPNEQGKSYSEDIKKNEEITHNKNSQMDVIIEEKKFELAEKNKEEEVHTNISERRDSKSSSSSPPITSKQNTQQNVKSKKELEDEAKAREAEKKKFEENARLKEIERKKIEAEIELKIKNDIEEQNQAKAEMERKIREEKDTKLKEELNNKYSDLKGQKENQLKEYRQMMVKLKEEKRNLKK